MKGSSLSKRAGKKRKAWREESWAEEVDSENRRVWRYQLLDREEGTYIKFVLDVQTGEILKDVTSLLSEHRDLKGTPA
jgi:hypothetical protein